VGCISRAMITTTTAILSLKTPQLTPTNQIMFEGYGGPVRIDQTDISGIDPTLDACCQREIEDNRKYNTLQATLRRHDRIGLAERRRRNVIDDLSFGSGCRCCYDPSQDGGEYAALIELRSIQPSDLPQVGQEQEAEADETKDIRKDEESDSDDDDGEFDYLLDEDLPDAASNPVLQSFQQERMEEMQLNAIMYESATQHGFGAHRQFHPQRILHAAGLGMGGIRGNRAAAIPPAAVIHLYDSESEMCASLDLCLEKLGQTYRGTKFVRSNGRQTLTFNGDLAKAELPKLSLDSGLPALIAVRDGVVIAVCPNLSALGNERDQRIEPHAVEHWLDNAGVLLRDVPLEYEDYCRIRPEEDALVENMMREKAKLADVYNCGVPGCNKTFRHEHVGVKNDEQSGLVLSEDIALGANGGN